MLWATIQSLVVRRYALESRIQKPLPQAARGSEVFAHYVDNCALEPLVGRPEAVSLRSCDAYGAVVVALYVSEGAEEGPLPRWCTHDCRVVDRSRRQVCDVFPEIGWLTPDWSGRASDVRSDAVFDFNRAIALEDLGREEDAERSYERSLEIDATHRGCTPKSGDPARKMRRRVWR